MKGLHLEYMKINQSFNVQKLIWHIGDIVAILGEKTNSNYKSIFLFSYTIGVNIRLSDDFIENMTMLDTRYIASITKDYMKKYCIKNE